MDRCRNKRRAIGNQEEKRRLFIATCALREEKNRPRRHSIKKKGKYVEGCTGSWTEEGGGQEKVLRTRSIEALGGTRRGNSSGGKSTSFRSDEGCSEEACRTERKIQCPSEGWRKLGEGGKDRENVPSEGPQKEGEASRKKSLGNLGQKE